MPTGPKHAQLVTSFACLPFHMSIYLYVYMSTCLHVQILPTHPWISTCLSSYQFICPPISFSTFTPNYISTSLPVYLQTCLSDNFSTCLHVCPFTCIPVYLSICTHVHLYIIHQKIMFGGAFSYIWHQIWLLLVISKIQYKF